ncbi:MAG: PfkB family carbohydrate kinase [Terracidiphilus sp.]|jgi:sugar/nucleoside kinase (ribokinase family)
MHKPRVLFLGRTTLDLLYRLDRMPEEDTKVYARDLQAAPGGPALNAAITHSLLGGRAMLISAVGGGPWAAPVRSQLRRHGIHLLDLAAGTAYETPLCAVLANTANATRTIVNPPISRVPLRRLGASWAAEVPSSWGGIPPVVLTDGFFFEESSALLSACKSAGAALCLDGGSWKPGTAKLAPLLTVAICSERFAIPGHSGGLDGDSEAVFAWFAAKGVPYVVVTRGSKSILASDRGRRFEIKVAKIAVTDTLGAGDVLHGAFCHHFAGKPDFEPALRRASAIATLSCQGLGAHAWARQPGSSTTA